MVGTNIGRGPHWRFTLFTHSDLCSCAISSNGVPSFAHFASDHHFVCVMTAFFGGASLMPALTGRPSPVNAVSGMEMMRHGNVSYADTQNLVKI